MTDPRIYARIERNKALNETGLGEALNPNPNTPKPDDSLNSVGTAFELEGCGIGDERATLL